MYSPPNHARLLVNGLNNQSVMMYTAPVTTVTDDPLMILRTTTATAAAAPGTWTSHPGADNSTAVINATDPFARNEDVARLEITVLSVSFVAAVVGNVSVLLAMHHTKKKRKASRMQLFIRHLSLADLVVAFFQVLPQLCWEVTYRFYGPDFLCRIVKHLQVMGMFASTYIMVMMTLDRYVAICHPLRTLRMRSTRRSYVAIAGVWALSLALATPQYFIFSLSEVARGSDVYDCWGHFVAPWGLRAYITWITVGIFLVPVAVLVLCYGFICRSIWNNVRCKTRPPPAAAGAGGGGAGSAAAAKKGLIGKSSVSSVTSISRAKLRTVKMTFVIVLAYVVCWAPFFIVQMWSVWDDGFQWDDSENTAVTLSALLASLNSCCNPWIYMLFSGGHFLRDFTRCFRHRCCCLCCCHASHFKKEDSDSSLRRTAATLLLTRTTTGSNNRTSPNTTTTCSSGTWRELDSSNHSPKSSLPAYIRQAEANC